MRTSTADVHAVDGNDGYQFIEHGVWIRSLNVEYFVGIDGISVTMVLLTALISFVGVSPASAIDKQLKGYFAMYCLLVTGMMGVFVALDLFLFYVFWEVMLLPMYFLIGIWGGPRKEYAAIKFFLYTLAGSVFMLLAFIGLYLNADPTYLVDGTLDTHTFTCPSSARVDYAAQGAHDPRAQRSSRSCWVALFVGFAIKIPMFPFHTWLPDAHVEAPTAISVILAGVLLKMGTYGILRINFAHPARGDRVGRAGDGGVRHHQHPLRRLLRHGAEGSEEARRLLVGQPHGLLPARAWPRSRRRASRRASCRCSTTALITAMLFTLVGVIYDRAHTRDIDKFGGLASEMPLYTAFVGFAFMASLGLPGLSGFCGEVLTFIGAFPRYRVLTILAATGVIITAAYHLWALQRMFLGKFREEWRTSQYLEAFGGKFPEINAREVADARCRSRSSCWCSASGPAACSTLIDRGRPRRASQHREPARADADRARELAGE